jgi:eukaryotic-like serine/threonine-protein kinase
LFPGRVIANRYRVLRVLGRGGMGVVSEVQTTDTSERYAIKFLRQDVESDIQPTARFWREAKLATRLKGAHACRVYEFGEWELGPYIVMELLEGRSLSDVVGRGRRLDWRQATRIGFEVCEALAEAHALGIVHRDVKPANVFLARGTDGSVTTKVLDFGVAKIPAKVVTLHAEPSLTGASLLLGTPSYVAPEQLINSKLVDARADIWAVGVLLYEMLSGQLPFSSPLVPKLLQKIAKEPPQPLVNLVPSLPRELVHIVHRCLEKDPALRYADAQTLAEELLPWFDATTDILGSLMPIAELRLSVSRDVLLPSDPTLLEPTDLQHEDSLLPHTTADLREHRPTLTWRASHVLTVVLLGVSAAVGYFAWPRVARLHDATPVAVSSPAPTQPHAPATPPPAVSMVVPAQTRADTAAPSASAQPAPIASSVANGPARAAMNGRIRATRFPRTVAAPSVTPPAPPKRRELDRDNPF